jgi:hypothetical protein
MTGKPSMASSVFAPTRLIDLPGARTLHSATFRTIVAAVLLAVGMTVVGSVLVRQASDPAGQYAIDFADYHRAAQRLAAGASPYAPEMMLAPVDAQGLDRYRYPPPLAQALVPVSGLPLDQAAALWLALQAAATLFAVLFAARLAGIRPGWEAACWCGVAVVYFLPVFDTLWKGNVSGFVALLVILAAGTARVAGGSVAIATLLKVAPVTLIPGLTGRGRPATLAVFVVAALVTATSLVLAPAAWVDYARVLPNLLAGDADYATNLAPAAMLGAAGSATAGIVRIATIVVAISCVALGWAAGRQDRGTQLALVLGVAAMLLLPAAIWYHYLAVLLPLGILAWPRAPHRARTALVAGGTAITAGIAWLPLATLGATTMIVTLLIVLRPGASAEGSRSGSRGS